MKIITWVHPELGAVLWDNGGAQSPGSCYDQGQLPSAQTAALLASGEIELNAELASDGWWWVLAGDWRNHREMFTHRIIKVSDLGITQAEMDKKYR